MLLNESPPVLDILGKYYGVLYVKQDNFIYILSSFIHSIINLKFSWQSSTSDICIFSSVTAKVKCAFLEFFILHDMSGTICIKWFYKIVFFLNKCRKYLIFFNRKEQDVFYIFIFFNFNNTQQSMKQGQKGRFSIYKEKTKLSILYQCSFY